MAWSRTAAVSPEPGLIFTEPLVLLSLLFLLIGYAFSFSEFL